MMGKTYPKKVGYRRPPEEHQFKPGQSGNPGGRGKGSKNLATLVTAATTETVGINSNGKKRIVSKLEAALMQLVNKAAAGDLKATKLLLDLSAMAEATAAASAPREPITPEARRDNNAKIMAVLKVRISDGGDDGGQD